LLRKPYAAAKGQVTRGDGIPALKRPELARGQKVNLKKSQSITLIHLARFKPLHKIYTKVHRRRSFENSQNTISNIYY